MCGILSYFNAAGISKSELEYCMSALQKLQHRGPDGEGVVLFNTQTGKRATIRTLETPAGISCDINNLNELEDKEYNLFLGHRRLNIIDLSVTGHQPMYDTSDDFCIIFNGEIYNYLELTTELKNLSHKFKSHSDTEVILEAYKEWGKECFNRFNGMWSIIIYDSRNEELVISNDRYGIKPLYFIKNEKELIFSSEIKPFFSFPSRIKAYYKNAIDTYIKYGYTNYDEHTFFNEVKKFPNANYAVIKLQDTSSFKPTRYYKIENLFNSPLSARVALDKFRFLINDAVKLTLRSDVSLGIAISGGLDSSYILSRASSLLKKETLNTYSAIFPGKEGDESEYIKLALNNLPCKSYFVDPLEQFSFDDFERYIASQDYPVESTSFYAEWCVSKLVKDSGVKILLNGQGADEIFAGYHHHFYKYCSELICKGYISEYKQNLKYYCSAKGLPPEKVQSIIFNDLKLRFKAMFSSPADLDEKWARASTLKELLCIDIEETTLPAYLHTNDRSSMAFSIESRLPFLDYRLVDFAMALPAKYKIQNGWQKWILREAGDSLPAKIRYRKDKKGFTTPQKEWVEKYRKEFRVNLPILDKIGIEKEDSLRHYMLSLWLKNTPEIK
jgi:asparagine synthase (glutamine-hydrolysing)